MHAPVNSYIRFKIPGFHADGVDLGTLTNMFLNDPLQGKVRELQMAWVLKLFKSVFCPYCSMIKLSEYIVYYLHILLFCNSIIFGP